MPSSLQQRQVLFISHALPEENEFVLWLAAKLRNEGYDVWCELEQIYGGEHFWKEIQEVLQTRAVKVLLVASQVSVMKDGVRDEWDYALSIARANKLKDFIIPIKYDDVSSNAIIGLTNLAMIQFQNSWAHGFKALLRKLDKDKVPKIQDFNPLSVKHWYLNRFATTNTVINKEETFYSNWVALPKLPPKLFLHEYATEAQAKQVVSYIQEKLDFPVARHQRYILAFEEKLPLIHVINTTSELFGSILIETMKSLEISIRKIKKREYKSETFPTTQDASNFLVQLIQQSVHNFLAKRGLKIYEMANSNLCYFYQQTENTDQKIKYLHGPKIRKKQLTGTYNNTAVWHYGVSFIMRIQPFPLISIKAHLLFSDDGMTIWEKKDSIRSARRKKGKRMFNAEWRDLLLAFLASLTEDQKAFGVPITSHEKLWLSASPVIFKSEKGYQDPKDEGRLNLLEAAEDEDDFMDEDFYTFDTERALSELESDSLHNEDINLTAGDINDIDYETI
ncbi:toll/interleukin-1 receptor domain-containing protein [Spirosoma sp. BT702]|uniref:Toll/interleukin-1 receptor domain-containing protein n=1 Tax=Spirosoma profusum TaxID=2771354 RepID=A0A926Y250_9BACT|nr:toll/interleukin-1 receptor domain-containing protein [Spirosoma profusum]MBD2704680.1 toll/interleukin-1 receptor domain-containing protein [Spirosoma profusum]